MPAKLRRKSLSKRRSSVVLPPLSPSTSSLDPLEPSSPLSQPPFAGHPAALASPTYAGVDYPSDSVDYSSTQPSTPPQRYSLSSPSPGPSSSRMSGYGTPPPQPAQGQHYSQQQNNSSYTPPSQLYSQPHSSNHSPQPGPPPHLAQGSMGDTAQRNSTYGQQHNYHQQPPRQYPPPSSSSPSSSLPTGNSALSPSHHQQQQQRHSPAPSPSHVSHGPDSRPSNIGARPTSTMLASQGSSRSLSSQQAGPPTIAGEPLHDLQRALALLKSSKFYAEGFLMKRVALTADGSEATGADSQWAKWFVQLSGTIMSTWNAAEMEEAARKNQTVPPQYLNLQDAFVHPLPPRAGEKTPTQFQFALNSAGRNCILFCTPSLQSLTMWINAIRLSVWERSRVQEIYTGTLLGLREPRPLGWQGFDGGLPGPNRTPGRFEGWVKARLPGETEWLRVWCVVQRGSAVPTRQSILGGAAPAPPSPVEEKRSRRSSLLSFGKKDKHKAPPASEEVVIPNVPGGGAVSTLSFWDRKESSGGGGKASKEPDRLLCIAQHVFYAAAIYPETEALVERSTVFKVEGTFLDPREGFQSGGRGVGGRADRQGYALLMLEEGNVMDMLHWIVGLSDVFKLYGRPRNFSFDPRDPSSFYFALPIGPHRDRQFLDRELVDNINIGEHRPRAIRATFHNLLFERMRSVRPPPTPGAPASTSSDARSLPSNSAPTSPVDGTDPSSRRWSQIPPSSSRDGNDAPRLPPMLPAIGEGSLVDEQNGAGANGEGQAVSTDIPSPKAAAMRIEPEGADARRMSIHRQATADRRTSQYGAPPGPQPAPPPAPSAEPPANNYLGDVGLRRASEGGSTAENDLASTYTAFLSSDIARERTPPPPVPASSTPRSQARSTFSNSPRLDRIDTGTFASSSSVPPSSLAHSSQHTSARGTPAPPSASAPTPPPPQSAGTEVLQTPHSLAGRSDLTHFTYAVPGASGPSHHFDHQLAASGSHQQSPIYSHPPPAVAGGEQRLPSPGAASALSLAAPLHQQHEPTPPSPGLAYLAESPAAAQNGFVQQNGAAPQLEELEKEREVEQLREPSPAPPAPPVPVVEPESVEQPQPEQPTQPQEVREKTSSHSLGTSMSQMHDGRVVDSSEQQAAPLPAEGADETYGTQPLFAGKGSPRVSRGPAEVEQDGERREETLREEVQNGAAGAPEDYNIHQDLLAALNFVDRSGSPELEPNTPVSPSSVAPTPDMREHKAFHVGPPKRGMFEPPSPSDEQYGFQGEDGDEQPAEILAAEKVKTNPSSAGNSSSSSTPAPVPQSFPSSFAKSKRDERVAAAQLAQQAKEAALTRPGRAPGQRQQKKKAWVDDSDDDEDDEEQEEDDESSEDEQPPSRRGPVQASASSASLAPSPANGSRGPSPARGPSPGMEMPPPPVPQQQQQQYHQPPPPQQLPQPHQHGISPSPSRPSLGVDAASRQSYLENGPGYGNYSTSPTRDGFSGPPHPQEQQYQPSLVAPPPPNRKPALNPHGLLATGMLEKEERSARAQEHAARDVGNTLLSLPAKPPPPQTGLVGALGAHQREKERTGGVGRALTEQQRERKLAEQRQKQLDEIQRQQLALYQQQMQMAQFGGGGFGSPMMGGMGSMGFAGSNPWMMGGGMMPPAMSGFGGFPGAGSHVGVPGQQSPTPLQPQGTGNGADAAAQAAAMQQQQQAMMAAQAAQMAAQQAAQAAAQQAYLAAMQQFSSPATSPGNASPTLPPTSFPGTSMGMPSMPSMGFMPGFGGFPGVSSPGSMMGSPSFAGAPFGFGHAQQPSFGGGPGSHFGGFPGAGVGGAGGLPGDSRFNSVGNSADNSDYEAAARAVSPLDLRTQGGAKRDGSQ
ncbi:hypothetical protein JCM8097_001822 [Rhodosporidiobolus ruineniae]